MKHAATTTVSALFCIGLYAQKDLRSEGIALMQQKKFIEAEVKFKENLTQNPDDARGWFFLGSSQLNQQKYPEAIESMKKSCQGDVKPASLKNEPYFQIAKSYAVLGDKINSLKYLTTLAGNNGGMSYIRRMETDKAFDVMKDDARIASIKESFTKNSLPCLYDPNSKKLDFFIGRWDVFVQGNGSEYDRKVGSDSVVQQPGGCSVLEYFTYFQPPGLGVPNFEGRSMSFYDHARQKYMHSWAGSSGDIINYEESSSGENTITFLATTNSSGSGLMHRRFKFTFNPVDKTIHQFIENSFDLGKTWTVDWDAVFRPKK